MVLLTILDGWGVGKEDENNPITVAKTPFFDHLNKSVPKTLIDSAGLEVGLPDGQMGNSEVGHLNIGAGRVIYQNLQAINKSLEDGSFFQNNILLTAIKKVKKQNSSLHLMGLISNGGVHSHMSHLFGLMEMAGREGIKKLYIHALCDGRDTPPKSAENYLIQIEEKIKANNNGKVATIIGRYYAMDRDNRWDRIENAYNALVYGKGISASDSIKALKQSYNDDLTDEFIKPTVIVDSSGNPVGKIQNGDSLICLNFRADRMRQILIALSDENFKQFNRVDKPDIDIVCMTEYDSAFQLPVAFPSELPRNTLSEVLSLKGIKQFHVAETEKYAHVTFFLNGGVEKSFPGEDRKLIPSPSISTYDLKPEMSAHEVTDTTISAIKSGKYEFIVVNFANPDMIGHTGIFSAAVKAVETIDECVKKVTEAAINYGDTVLITADHGNIEKMTEENGGAFTAHTTNKVPFYCISKKKITLRDGGRLADIAPTILHIMEIEKPDEMTGESLIC